MSNMKETILYSLRNMALGLTLTFLTAETALAQDEPAVETPSEEGDGGDEDRGRKRVSGGQGYITAGYHMFKMDEYNAYFAPDALPAVKDNGISLGGGFNIIVRNLVLGGVWSNILEKSSSASQLDAKLKSSMGLFQVGYVVFAKKGFLVYPKVGIGNFNNDLTLKENRQTTTFDTISAGNYPGSLLNNRGLLGNAELNLDWMPGFDESSGGGLMFGLGVGYNMGLTDKGWDTYGTTVTGGPAIDLSGLYVRLRIGFGGWNLQ
jgi:hypothetical protein